MQLTPAAAMPQDENLVAEFDGLLRSTRAVTAAVTLVLVAATVPHGILTWFLILVVLGEATVRLFRPIRINDDLRSLMLVLGEVALQSVAVIATGSWRSPLVFMLLNAVIIAGFARGFGFAIMIAVAIGVMVSVPEVSSALDPRAAIAESVSWSTIIILVGVVAGYARRLHNQANAVHHRTLGRLEKLQDANQLLHSLHRVAQSLPESLDLAEVLDSTMLRIRALLDFHSAALILFDETDAQWTIARHEGLEQGGRLGPTELPVGLRRAIALNGTVHITDFGQVAAHEVRSLHPGSGSGLYAVLVARDVIIGLLVLEHTEPGHYGDRDVELIDGLVAPASLAVDNARWFARLRTLGADEERTRIARDLHDRIGQSLAYLGIELDRLVARHDSGEDIDVDIARLRDDVRTITREVRDTLYDLRTDITESETMEEVLTQYAAKVAERSGMQIRVESDQRGRLPLVQERELWRIAQEALGNAEKHAGATAVRVLWRCDDERAVLDVTDNGSGFEEGVSGRVDSYGVLGMRERAAGIGATLEIVSAPGRGTRVRCVLTPPAATPHPEPGGRTAPIDPPVLDLTSGEMP